VPLLVTRRHLRHCPLVHLPNPLQRILRTLLSPVRILLQPGVIKPNVVVPCLVRQLLLVLQPPLAENGDFDTGAGTVLLLEVGVGGVKLGGAGTGKAVEGELWKEAKVSGRT
jgi:hypothetical protein